MSIYLEYKKKMESFNANFFSSFVSSEFYFSTE